MIIRGVSTRLLFQARVEDEGRERVCEMRGTLMALAATVAHPHVTATLPGVPTEYGSLESGDGHAGNSMRCIRACTHTHRMATHIYLYIVMYTTALTSLRAVGVCLWSRAATAAGLALVGHPHSMTFALYLLCLRRLAHGIRLCVNHVRCVQHRQDGRVQLVGAALPLLQHQRLLRHAVIRVAILRPRTVPGRVFL